MDTSEDFSQYIRWREENGKTICLECGAEMLYFREGHCCGLKCTKCENGIATTAPIVTDPTAYAVALKPSNRSAVGNVRLIANIAGVNWLQAKKLIESAPSEIFRGQALKVQGIKNQLEAAGIKYKIEPEFPY